MKHILTRILCLVLFVGSTGCSDYIAIELLRPEWVVTDAIDINNNGVVIGQEGGFGQHGTLHLQRRYIHQTAAASRIGIYVCYRYK